MRANNANKLLFGVQIYTDNTHYVPTHNDNVCAIIILPESTYHVFLSVMKKKDVQIKTHI